MSDYLYLIWYGIALIVVGVMLFQLLKQRGFYTKKDVEEHEVAMTKTYGKKGYSIIKIIGWFALILFWFLMLGQCAQSHLKM